MSNEPPATPPAEIVEATEPPSAKQVPSQRTFHGDTVTDEYAWLTSKDDPDTIGYLTAENAYAETATAGLDSLRDEIFEEIKAPLWAARARAELVRISGRAPGPRELTVTEQRVAELVARGMSNREVAAELFVSVRAVESTLTKTYAKLGLRSRAELLTRWHRLD